MRQHPSVVISTCLFGIAVCLTVMFTARQPLAFFGALAFTVPILIILQTGPP